MKILIVDDERMICEWLQFCIQRNPGCELVGCAHNGEQALALFLEHPADVVFTDIKMPVMDGLELLKRIKETEPRTIVVVLTAFAEFDLVREAIRLGGDNYLLKTEMNNQTFDEVLLDIEKKLPAADTRERERKQTDAGQQQSIVSDILRNKSSLTEEDRKRLRDCHIHWRDGGLFAVAVWRKELLKDFILPESPLIHHVAGFEHDSFIYVMVGNVTGDISELKKSQALYQYASLIVSENGCMAGISSFTERLSEVRLVITQAACALSQGYYEARIKVWTVAQGGEEILYGEAGFEQECRKKRRELYELAGHEFYEKIHEFMEEAKTKRAVPIRELSAFCCDAMEMAFMRFAMEDAKLMHHLLLEEKKAVREAVEFQQAKERTLEFVKNVLACQEVDERKLSRGVAAAVDYVRKHYSQPISLETVSKEAGFNTDYLSRIFKEEVGMTYSAFLSEVRLKKAAYLLSHTPERIQKIAESVGYPNVSYFSTTFKKRYGVNPYEYRRGE